MKPKFHVRQIKGIEGGWDLWAILVTDSDGKHFAWDRQIQGDHWSCIFHSRTEALHFAEHLAKQFHGEVRADLKLDHYLIPQETPEPCCGTDLSE